MSLCVISHRARVLYSKLSSESHAVTIIAAYFRGYLHRKRYMELKARHYAAIKIQAFTRLDKLERAIVYLIHIKTVPIFNFCTK